MVWAVDSPTVSSPCNMQDTARLMSDVAEWNGGYSPADLLLTSMMVMYSAITLSIERHVSYTLLYTVSTPWTHLHRRRNFSSPTPSLWRTRARLSIADICYV